MTLYIIKRVLQVISLRLLVTYEFIEQNGFTIQFNLILSFVQINKKLVYLSPLKIGIVMHQQPKGYSIDYRKFRILELV